MTPDQRADQCSRALALLAAAFVALLAVGCTSVEDARIRQLLHEKGFGTRAEGVATAENYVGGGDLVQFIVDPDVYQLPGQEQLYILANAQPVGLDGTIFVPYIGSVYVLGLTEQSLSNMVSQLLAGIFTAPIQVQARIISRGKGFYMFGEVTQAARFVPLTKADMTLLEVIARAPITDLANMGRVKVIKPDAQNPLVVVVNVREMIETGNTTYNLRIDDNDIIYIPPTFLGHIARFLEKLLQPLNRVVGSALGIATIRSTYDYLFLGEPTFFGRGNRF
ncbi:MAG: polysaccharide biosynthesis/export family protein [Planctomycetes bacterium]|nr:polysaccharide biosynthesis/export family protein [Planctomycetota bacterium]